MCKTSIKKIFIKRKVTLQKYRPIFVTADNIQHEGLKYNWVIADRLICSVPKYIMVDIKSDGYIEDKNKIMYSLSNVLSIEWKLVDEKVVEDNFSKYQIFVTTEELERVKNDSFI